MSQYDSLSPWYDLLAESSEGKLRQVALALLAARPGEHILEIGPGTGHGLVTLAQAVGTSGLVCGIDLSAGMLHQASRRVKRADAAQQVSLCRADGLALPFQEQVFDAAFLSFTLELFEDPQPSALLREIGRVVRPGGRLAVAALAQGRGGRMVAAYQWAHRRFPRVVDCRPIQVERELTRVGWRIESAVQRQMWGLPVTLALGLRSETFSFYP